MSVIEEAQPERVEKPKKKRVFKTLEAPQPKELLPAPVVKAPNMFKPLSVPEPRIDPSLDAKENRKKLKREMEQLKSEQAWEEDWGSKEKAAEIQAEIGEVAQAIADTERDPVETLEAAPEPKVIEKIVEVEKIIEVENTERLEELESQLKAAQEALAARPETVIPDTGPEPIEASYDEPPAEIADLIDPSLTPKQNLDVLTAKFAAAKNLEEYARNNGDMTGAMQHLRDAERFESGIKWNRAVLVEVV